MTTAPMTPQQLLDLPLPDNDSGASTVRGYLAALTERVWEENECFSGKRPFGNGGWQFDLYVPMIRAGLVGGTFYEDGDLEDVDEDAADKLILEAIRAMGEAK